MSDMLDSRNRVLSRWQLTVVMPEKNREDKRPLLRVSETSPFEVFIPNFRVVLAYLTAWSLCRRRGGTQHGVRGVHETMTTMQRHSATDEVLVRDSKSNAVIARELEIGF
ncbi:hypothetical protein FRIGORI9N_400109 [Frigoribacterium sp. 9N]|nr:hypothetical protein FRIGORI9N_400109 [Frigoribacterium sp. 9N]